MDGDSLCESPLGNPLQGFLALWGSGRQITTQGQASSDLSGIPACTREGMTAEGQLSCTSTCYFSHLDKSLSKSVGALLLLQSTGGGTGACVSHVSVWQQLSTARVARLGVDLCLLETLFGNEREEQGAWSQCRSCNSRYVHPIYHHKSCRSPSLPETLKIYPKEFTLAKPQTTLEKPQKPIWHSDLLYIWQKARARLGLHPLCPHRAQWELFGCSEQTVSMETSDFCL